MTWNVARGGVAVATDASEVYAVSAAVGLGEFSEAVSTGGELVVPDSAVRASAAVGLGELSAAVSIGGGLVVADSAVGVFAAVGIAGSGERRVGGEGRSGWGAY